MVHRALSASGIEHVIAADGGARNAWFYARSVDTVIGDLDSLSPAYVQKLEADGTQIIRHPMEKDETDLELSLIYAAELGATWIRVVGAIGGRFDQMLANVYLLGLPQLKEIDTAIVAGSQMIQLLRPDTHILHGSKGDTISLIPISGDVTGISTSGLKYALNNETLVFGPARGISNVMASEQATMRFQSGLLLCIHTDGRA